MSTLYLVATPIGNLEDISARALRVLKEASLIAAEDTRQTLKLMNYFDLHTPLTSYHEHNQPGKTGRVLAALAQGDVALVSDAGTPGLNDPGYELVQAALQAGHTVSPVPGPCAPIAALVTSGLPTEAFLYLGYLPRKLQERRQLLESIASLPYTLIFLETPHRLLTALADLLGVLGDRPAAAARELTKLHEEIVRGTLSQVQAHFSVQAPRGEFTLVVAGCPVETVRWTDERLHAEVEAAVRKGEPAAQAARRIAAASGWRRRDVYSRLSQTRAGEETSHEPG